MCLLPLILFRLITSHLQRPTCSWIRCWLRSMWFSVRNSRRMSRDRLNWSSRGGASSEEKCQTVGKWVKKGHCYLPYYYVRMPCRQKGRHNMLSFSPIFRWRATGSSRPWIQLGNGSKRIRLVDANFNHSTLPYLAGIILDGAWTYPIIIVWTFFVAVDEFPLFI